NWQNGLGQTIPLNENFRSREGLLNFINSLFTRLMCPELGSVGYEAQAQLRFGAAGERRALSVAAANGPCVELHVRLKQAMPDAALEEESDDELAEMLELEEAAKEARLVAWRLREL